MISLARSFGAMPRHSARPCSVTTQSRSCSVWSMCEQCGTTQEMPFGSVLLGRRRRGVHDLQEAVAQEVAGAAETVDHPGAADQGRVGVGIHVDLDRGVHGDTPETTDRLRCIGDRQRAQGDLVEVLVPVLEEAREARVLGEGEGAGRGAVKPARVEQVEHGVLQHFGVDGEVVEGTLGQTADDGVGDGTDARLQRQQVLRQATRFHFVGEEVDDVAGDRLGGFVHVGEGTALVAKLRLDNGNDLARIAGNRGRADPGTGLGDVEDLAVRRVVAGDHVVDPFEGRLSGVDLDDDLVADHQDFGDNAAGTGRHQAAVFGDGGNFDDGQVEFAARGILGVEAVAEVLGEEGEVFVAHADATLVDARGDIFAGLIGPAAVDHVEGRPAVFGFGADGSADEEVELPLALKVVLLDMVGQGDRNHFGVTGRGKAGPAEVHAGLEELDRVLGGHDLAQQGLAANAILQCSVIGHLSPPL